MRATPTLLILGVGAAILAGCGKPTAASDQAAGNGSTVGLDIFSLERALGVGWTLSRVASVVRFDLLCWSCC